MSLGTQATASPDHPSFSGSRKRQGFSLPNGQWFLSTLFCVTGM